MPILKYLYVASSGLLVLSGLAMVGMAVRAYRQTTNRALIHLSIGFCLIAAAAAATAISAFLIDFARVQTLLLVNSGFSSFGYIFVVYSLLTYN
jgi:hypothetical protein